ncbi:MAG: amidohydrolase family protein [Actinomycetota bacterium]
MERIIDVHGHLGNVLFPGGGDHILHTGAKRRRFEFIRVMDRISIHAPALNKLVFKVLYRVPGGERLAVKLVAHADRVRNDAATLEHLRHDLDKYGVSHFVALPVSPNVLFDDVLAAAERDERVIPFTTVDFDDLDNVEARLADDVRRGARGLKLHPILQRVALDSDEMATAIAAFAPHGLPVLFHAGKCSYYDGCPCHRHREEPENGDIMTAAPLVERFPDVRFIAAHGALDEVDELIEGFGGLPNVWVDASFQEPGNILRLVEAFGRDRVMYAADWPYGGMPLALHRSRQAAGDDDELRDRLLYRNAEELLGID